MYVFVCCLLSGLFVPACSRPPATDVANDRAPSTDTAEDVATAGRLEPQSSAVPAEPAARLDAEVVLASALAEAKSADKNVFIHVGAPW
jgi:hypothetical protein